TIVPVHELTLSGDEITWRSLDDVRELVQRFLADHGEVSGIAVPFFIALVTLTSGVRFRALDASAPPVNPDDLERLRVVVDELDTLGRNLLMKHPEMRYWDARQQPGDLGRPA